MYIYFSELDIQLFHSAIKKIGKIVNIVYIYIYINIESTMNGYKFY